MAEKKKRKEVKAGKGRRPPEKSPDDRGVTEGQARYLSGRTGIATKELAALSLGQLHERLRFQLDPWLLGFQRVCGRVVRRDPVTGELYPVPFATVHVEDTDCNVLFYAPPDYGYVWIYPGLCGREEIATVQTDECGRFCVWIPRWEVDRVLRWRRERICFPILERPRIIDILEGLVEIPEIPDPPLPDPPPDFTDPRIRREVETRLGPELADRLARIAPDRTFGAYRGGLDRALLAPAPRELLPRPPAPDLERVKKQELRDERLRKVDLRRPLGPFRICRDVFVPEWQTILDVPDITFRVTQEQGGGEVTIYSEGFFDVRWNDTSIGDVLLEAGPNAQWVEICGEGSDVPCEDEPAILNISEMPLQAGYHDDSNGDPTFGYGIRVNQPSPDGVATPVPGPAAGSAHAPYADRLNFYGCFHIEGSTHYRVVASFEGGAQQPITGVTFPVLTNAFLVDHQTPDGEGWYPIRNDLISSYQHLILPWPTQQTRFADGTWELVLQVGSATGSGVGVDAESDPYTFELDNSKPSATFHQIRWWHESDGPGSALTLPAVCPVLNRRTGEDVIVEVRWSASSAHLRSADAGFGGCGAGSPVPLGNLSDRRWWWQDPTDTTTGVKVVRWRIPGSLAAGCYTVGLNAVSRAYNPAVPGASTTSDWFVLESRREVHPRKAISVVDV